ncbi:MAG: S9 family peptidase [Thermoanaerobaculia bacterium]|nr:S9 family peptidase [Thermoanaerobaculia bacterium]MDI9631299.1 prolyl oligopeptidase family serine peptidase [Acidobacteriota bacterium]MBP7812022.1 S9 family peptidase [Thermoanaerobaculia bacterium]MBP8845418.1 S9 family peptidase [Thermoanaerobaculia bacterium]HPA95159.1 prolyl oligopeptidase family serine peptidase [Thermoanaerobaculia bacterium]
MRQRSTFALALLLLLAAASFASPAVAASARKAAKEPPATALTVGSWLQLGPAPGPLPVFGDESRGGYGTAELLSAAPLPPFEALPVAGAEVPWFGGGSQVWREVAAGRDGLVTLGAAASGTPRLAWLAAQVHVPRWQAVEIELRGSHARRLLLDGREVATSGAKAPAGEVKSSVKLLPGSHLLLVQTLAEPGAAGAWTAGVRFTAAGAPPQLAFATTPERSLDLLDILDRTEVASIALSPDGKLIAIGLRRIVPGTDDPESWVEVRATADGALRWSRRGAETRGVAWAAPRRLGFTTTEKRGKEGTAATLWLADLATGAVTPLLERIENFAGYRWVNEDTVVYSTFTRAEPDSRGIKLVESLVDRQEGARDRSYLWLARLPDGVRLRLTAGEESSRVEAIAPDGSRLLFTRQFEDLEARPFLRTELWETDLTTLAAKKLRDFRWLDDAAYAPGGRLLLVAGPSEFGDAGVALPPEVIPNEGDGQLYLWTPGTDEVEALSRDFDPSVASAEWNEAADAVLLRAAVRNEVGAFRLDLGTREYTRLETGSAVLSGFSPARDAAALAVSGSGPWQPERVAFLDLVTGETRLLLDPADSWMPAVRRGRVESWQCTVASGVTIDGRIYLPPDFDPERTYPAIVNYYAGTTPIDQAFGGRYPKEWWAAQGYVVYVPQPSGAIGYGQAHSARHVNEWGSLVVDEIIDATRQFVAAHPYVDGKRLGAIGASYGGFTTMSLVTKTDLFAAAVSHAGISSISSYWGEGYWGYTYNARSAAGSFPWNRPDLYVGQSPLFAADRVKTPLLLTHGRADTNVPVGESDTFFTALKLLGAPVEYLQVEGLDHLILEHAKRIVWSRAIVAWFDRYLKDEPQWWEELKTAPKKG